MTDSMIPSRAIVIGAGLGGLASAMRLGAKGYQVTVIDKLDRVGGRGSSITQGGYRFDLGPTIVTVPQGLRDLWAACGRDFDREVTLKPMKPFYEIRWADGSSFRLHADKAATEAEVEALSPNDLPGFRKFLSDAEDRYWFGYEDLGRRPMNELWELIKVLPRFVWLRADRSVYAHAARRVRDPRLRFALSFHPLFIGGDPFRVTSMYILVSHLESQFGVHYAMGGVQAIADAMANVIRDQGGQIKMSTEVDEIMVENGRASGVRLIDGSQLRADVTISNADAGHTYTRLLRNRTRKRWTDAKVKRQRWSMGLFVWYFGTRGKLADDMSLYVHRPSVTDPSVAPDGDDTFYVLSPVPHLGFDNGVDWAVEEDPYRQKMLAMLEDRLLPGLSERVTESLVFTPETFRDRYLSPLGAGFSIEPRILQSAYFRPHNVSEELPGLYLAGAGTHPGAGVPGVIGTAEVMGQLVPDAPRPMAPPLPMAAE